MTSRQPPGDLMFGSRLWTVCVRASLARRLQALYDSYPDNELYAPIVGRYSDDGTVAICSAMLAFHPGQRFEVELNERDAAGVARSLADLWEDTGGEIYYLGDWHTHPGAVASPSPTDRSTARRRAGDHAAKCPQMVVLIAGSDGLRCSIATATGEFRELHRLRSEAA